MQRSQWNSCDSAIQEKLAFKTHLLPLSVAASGPGCVPVGDFINLSGGSQTIRSELGCRRPDAKATRKSSPATSHYARATQTLSC